MSKQRGMTLLEVMVALAIVGSIVGLLFTFIVLSFRLSGTGSDRLTVVQELELASRWLSQDIVGASKIETDSGNKLILTFPDRPAITYTYEQPDKGLKRTIGGTSGTVARNIESVKFSFNTTTKLLTVELTSSPVGRWGIKEEKRYRFYSRVYGS